MFQKINLQGFRQNNYTTIDIDIIDSDFIFKDYIKIWDDLNYNYDIKIEVLIEKVFKIYYDKGLDIAKNLTLLFIHIYETYPFNIENLSNILDLLQEKIPELNIYKNSIKNNFKKYLLLK